MFYTHTDPLTKEVTLAKHVDDTRIYFTEQSEIWVEYQEWLAQGNTPEENNNGL